MSPPHVHHAIDYVEIAVTDIEAAKAFYSAAFGWSLVDYGPDYAGIQADGREQGGLRRDSEVRAGGPLVILYSDDLEASVAAVTTAGGSIVKPIYEFPGGRRFHFADPAGNELAVWSEREERQKGQTQMSRRRPTTAYPSRARQKGQTQMS